jgi:hypothetical protein
LLTRAFHDHDTLLDPNDIATAVEKFMQKPAVRHFTGPIEVRADRLFCVRDWKGWVTNLNVNVSGGLLTDATANHFFMFLRRRGADTFHVCVGSARMCPFETPNGHPSTL